MGDSAGAELDGVAADARGVQNEGVPVGGHLDGAVRAFGGVGLLGVVEVGELAVVVHHGQVLRRRGLGARQLAGDVRGAVVAQAQGVTELVEDGVAELLIAVDLVIVGDEEGAVADQGDAGGVVAAINLVADDA